jgi:hypothetical protein
MNEAGVRLEALALRDKGLAGELANLRRMVLELRGVEIFNDSAADIPYGGILAPTNVWDATMRWAKYGLPVAPWLQTVAVALEPINSKCGGRTASGGRQIVRVDGWSSIEVGAGLVAKAGTYLAQQAMGGWWTVIAKLPSPLVIADFGGMN